MANENAFKIIDMQALIQQHMEGHISEEQLIEQCKAVLGK
jgi:ribonucleotide reductase alpha subunit